MFVYGVQNTDVHQTSNKTGLCKYPKTDTAFSGRFGNSNYLGNRKPPDTGYTELGREVAPPPKNIKCCKNYGYKF